MKSILEELFYGNVCPNTDCRSKEKEALKKFDDCYSELTDINEREIFVYAFKLGMRIAIEVLYPYRKLGGTQ